MAHPTSRSLSVAMLLIVSGGFMDAHTFIAYDHVFTNAQSGNVVLFAVYAARGDWGPALTHVPPMLAFFPGIFAARWLEQRVFAGRATASDTLALCAELAILAVVAAVCTVLPGAAVTFSIAFASSMQNTAFKTVEGASYTSVVTTGNLRSCAEAWYEGLAEGKPEALRKAALLGKVCAGFAVGAILGAVLTWSFGRAAIVAPIVLIAAATAVCLRTSR